MQKQIVLSVNPDRLAHFFRLIKPVTTNHPLIRIGGEFDGGYLIPDDLDKIKVCFSPGVSTIVDFELDLVKRGITCFLADYSVEAPPVQNKLFHFEKKYLGPSETSTDMTLENWVKKSAPNQTDYILQMDIEGGEYGVIFDTSSEILRKFRIMVIEFHSMYALIDKFGWELINLAFTKILKDFKIVHIHPNNCCRSIVYNKFEIPPVVEFTFLRKDRITEMEPSLFFPHPSDRKNVPENNDLLLPSCWYK
ncbi:FkbM family methyltransferase [Pelodictyon phaeoclathratiforme]|jgi:hypothetical protein|uniref:Methyltransferase FkbM domain-containing protein n=1 Tax=Pelodictyon phaeoclathratiforme (strain DSM 5477 / BU-1) TaxID=324925 RepID=B4SDU7_PELPB|nr:FkbM family methyltransferase [Pelodictyon phaeoclathratiforme]ACF42938.1 conserved hypothetical protein [Pelodictyon phaeoclathratiforme BU-1]MBV5289646.1 FkbM family methyltransferase [Pelodictyon phaeoclathratiforme]